MSCKTLSIPSIIGFCQGSGVSPFLTLRNIDKIGVGHRGTCSTSLFFTFVLPLAQGLGSVLSPVVDNSWRRILCPSLTLCVFMCLCVSVCVYVSVCVFLCVLVCVCQCLTTDVGTYLRPITRSKKLARHCCKRPPNVTAIVGIIIRVVVRATFNSKVKLNRPAVLPDEQSRKQKLF